jgi:putative hemolysin
MPFMMRYLTEGLIILGMLALNAVFAAFEIALASVSQARLVVLANEKRRGAASALYLKERMGVSLAVIQVGITLASAVAAAVGGAGVQESVAPRLQSLWHLTPGVAQGLAVTFFVIPLSAFAIVFGELLPKVFAIENKEWMCLRVAPAMRGFAWMIWPVAHFFEGFVKGILKVIRKVVGAKTVELGDIAGFHELHAAVSLARTQQLMGARQERIVMSAAQLSRRKIREIILPASEISMIPSNLTLGDGLVRAHLDLHTRFPICGDESNPQTIEGYITFKDLVTALKMRAETPTVKGIARPIKRLSEETALSQVLEQMIKEKLHIALVVSAADKVLGLVTLEDIIEELVGDIEDEEDSLPIHMHPTSGGWLMGGGVPMNAVTSRLGVAWSPALAKENTVRLADWCVQVLDRPLEKGETLRAQGIQVTVRKLRRRKLAEAFTSRAPDTLDPRLASGMTE